MIDIKGYEGRYAVTEDGRVWSHISQRFLKPNTNTKGYYYVNLFSNGKGRSFVVHRLVANAYIENPLSLPQINHKDCDKLNNCVNNLEWCDNSANQIHAYKHGLQKSKRRITRQQIKEMRDLYFSKKYKLKELAEKYGYKSTGGVCDLIHHYGGD